MSKRPWMPFYVGDWLSSKAVLLMTPEQRGGYIQLLCHAWASDDGGLNDDDTELATLSGLGTRWDTCSGGVRKGFISEGGRLYNPRLRTELEKIQGRSVKATESANMRWQCERNANALQPDCESQCERNATHTQTHTHKEPTTSAPRRSIERSAPEDVFLEIPCIGTPDNFQLTKAKVAEWEKLYGVALNVRREILRAVQWLKDNPSKAKTARGMTRYLNGWLDREVNRNPIKVVGQAQKTQPGVYGGTCSACSDLGVLRIEGHWRRCTCDKARGISDAELAKANERAIA